MDIHIGPTKDRCDLCGRSFADFEVDATRKSYRCNKCERIVCAACYYEHSECGRYLCKQCLRHYFVVRNDHTQFPPRGVRAQQDHRFNVLVMSSGGECKECQRSNNWWYCVHDLIMCKRS